MLYKLGAGLTSEQILGDHLHIEIEDIHAAQKYAADKIGIKKLQI
ncbi:MAG: hypothetical protein ACFCU6_01635 [Balneolaceae bacterium]